METGDILALLQKDWEELREEALRSLLTHKGRHVFVRGLIEFSNICRRNCLYCGLRAQNRNLQRYRLSQGEIIAAAARAVAAGADSIVLQSGEGACQAAWLAEVVYEIWRVHQVPITLSVGECPEKDYALWRQNGACRYLLKHETADPGLYGRLHPGHTLSDRLGCLMALKELGYEIGSGFMTGLPGQDLETMARDIKLCLDLGVDMAGVGPFIAQGSTPLARKPSGNPDLTLRAIAALRIVHPRANLPATTALASLDPQEGQIRGLMAGANVLMPSFTPAAQAANYKIYDKKAKPDISGAAKAIEACGRSHSLKN